MEKLIKKKSKFLSLVLRHRPELIGIELDQQGWVDVSELLDKCNTFGERLDANLLNDIVIKNDKQRFAYSESGEKIRANQGHSIKIDLDYQPIAPPEFLYHGTAVGYINSIRQQGLKKRSRHHVHLSANKGTAKSVGGRHGKPVILIVKSGLMQEAGHSFFLSENGVWLTEMVPSDFIEFPSLK